MTNYPWYAVVHGASLEQGDVFRDFPVFIPPAMFALDALEAGSDSEVDIELTDVMVLTQSCDLDRDKVGNVLLAPINSLTEFADQISGMTRKALYKDLKANRRYSAHILDRCTLHGFECGHLVVNFAVITTVSFRTLEAFSTNSPPRLRLLSPYREQMSQAFGRFIMRVGLPHDLSPLDE